LLIKYIKSVLWRVVKRLSYIEDARCLKVNLERNLNECKNSLKFDMTAYISTSTVLSYFQHI